MRSAAYLTSSDEDRAQLRRRLLALAIVIAVHVLLVLALIFLARARLLPVKLTPDLQMITLLPPSDPAPRPLPRPRSGGSKHAEKKSVSKPVSTPPIPPAPSRIQLIPGAETFDLAKTTPDHSLTQTADAGNGTGAGTDSGSAYGPGGGPRGETLYRAEWVREPSRAELATYLPREIPKDAWANIACRTIPGFRVEDCEELGESPPGSHLSRALREASWQFRVRPPRVGGKIMVGTWVEIHFSFSDAPEG